MTRPRQPDLTARLIRRAGDPGCYLARPGAGGPIAGAAPVDLSTTGHAEDSDAEPGPDEAALVLFTSGSTGDPKGVVLTWRALEHRWRSRDAEYEPFGADRRQPLVIPLDSSWGVAKVADVASGFAERIVDVARMRPTDFLVDMAEFEPTAMAVPSQLARLLAQLPARLSVPLPSVRRLHIAAEGFRYEYMSGLRAIFEPTTSIVHSLASSEGGREVATSFALQDAPTTGPVHIGHPLFPDDLILAPVDGTADEVREVHVGGAIAVGYLDDPALTAERFYTDADGRRWWRSRDLVSVDDGLLLHRGRLDDVVKTGGKLASPADVTAVLVAVDGIAGAITVPVTIEGSTRLVAHVEVEDGAIVTLAQVRAALSARLPAHAVPSAVMRHAHLPVNQRGKVDRTALTNGPFQSW